MRTVAIRLFVCVLVSLGLGALTFLTMDSVTQARPAADVGPDLNTSKYTSWPYEPLVEPGGMITFAVLVENFGVGWAQNVVLTDTLPPGLTYVGGNNNLCGGPCADPVVQGQQVIWSLGNLAPDMRYQYFEFWARVSNTVTVGTILTNTVEIRGANAEVDSNPTDEVTDPYANNRRSLTIEIIPPTADLQISKRVSAGVVAAGESLRYEITLINQGAGLADDVIITDTLPVSVTFLTSASGYPTDDPVPITPTVAGRTIVWHIGSVPAHGRGHLTVDVRVSDTVTVGATLTNVVTISTSSPELVFFSNQPEPTPATVVSNTPNLWVHEYSDGQRTPGNQFNYFIRLTNYGAASATGVRITDTLPAELRYITSTSHSCLDPLDPTQCQINLFTVTVQGRQISWEIGRVPPGIGDTNIIMTVEVSPTVVPGTMITNVVTIGGNEVDNYPDDNVFTSVLPVVESSDPDISVFKSLESAPPQPGDPIVYRLRVINQGAFALDNVILTDTLPSSVTLRETVNTTCFTPPACVDNAFAPTVQNNSLVWNLGEIAVNGHGSFWVTVDVPLTVTAGTILTNTARISTTAIETDLTDNESLAAVTVVGEPWLTIHKYALASVLQGYPITYTLVVGNFGDVAATGLVITDIIPAGAFLRSVNGGVTANGVVTWTVSRLDPITEVAVSFAVTATETISNSRYAVTAREGVSATGDVVTTTVIGLTAANSSPARVGAPTHFTATLSSPTPMTYQWHFGDGIVSAPTAASTITHAYARYGAYTAVVTATGGLGSLTVTTPVVIRPYPIYLPLLSRQ